MPNSDAEIIKILYNGLWITLRQACAQGETWDEQLPPWESFDGLVNTIRTTEKNQPLAANCVSFNIRYGGDLQLAVPAVIVRQLAVLLLGQTGLVWLTVCATITDLQQHVFYYTGLGTISNSLLLELSTWIIDYKE